MIKSLTVAQKQKTHPDIHIKVELIMANQTDINIKVGIKRGTMTAGTRRTTASTVMIADMAVTHPERTGAYGPNRNRRKEWRAWRHAAWR